MRKIALEEDFVTPELAKCGESRPRPTPCGRDGPQSREGLEEALRPGMLGPPCRLLGRLVRNGGGRVVRSEERRNWSGRTNFGRA
jgi:hypothetical protein